MTRFSVGDRVRYADHFMARVYGQEMAPLRGSVTEVIPAQVKPGCVIPARLKILWDDCPSGSVGALEKNISKAR